MSEVTKILPARVDVGDVVRARDGRRYVVSTHQYLYRTGYAGLCWGGIWVSQEMHGPVTTHDFRIRNEHAKSYPGDSKPMLTLVPEDEWSKIKPRRSEDGATVVLTMGPVVVDHLDMTVGNVAVRDLLARYGAAMRNECAPNMTEAQLEAAKKAWGVELRRRVRAGEEKEIRETRVLADIQDID